MEAIGRLRAGIAGARQHLTAGTIRFSLIPAQYRPIFLAEDYMKNVAFIARSDGKEKEIPENDFKDLDGKLSGRVILPHDEAYRSATTVWNGLLNTEPAVVALCLNQNDVLTSLEFARDFDMSVSVKGGGHSVSEKGLLERGMVLDVSAMNKFSLDKEKRQLTVGGGTTFDTINPIVEKFGLAVPSGFVSMMGVGGLSLRGGLGPLMRKYGLTCDSINSLNLARADGTILTANERDNSELFWALRGGSESLGVITDITYDLHEIGPEVTRIHIGFPMQRGREVLRRVEEYINSAPPEVGLNVYYGDLAAGASGGPGAHGAPGGEESRPAIIIYGLFFGPAADEAHVLDPLRGLGTPIFDETKRLPYSAAQRTLSFHYPQGGRYYWRSLFVDHFSDELLAVMTAHAQNRVSPQSRLGVWTMGGKVRSIDSVSTAVPYRNASFMIAVESNWTDESRDAENIEWGRDAWRDMHEYSSGGVYLNFAGIGHEPKEATLRGYDYDHERLSAVKKSHDPENMFK